jgi:hypothetical protein
MGVSLSTLSQTEASFEKIEQEAAAQTAETNTSQNSQPQEQTSESQPVQTGAEQKPEETKEDNVSSFSTDLGGEKPEEQPDEKLGQKQPVYDWRSEIKKADPKEVAKELGLTDFAIEINEYQKKGGNPADYIAAKAIDYNQVSDEDLIKTDYRKQFPNLTKTEIDRLFNRKYGVADDMTEEEKEDRLIQLKADGHLKRQEKITEQQRFKIPEANIPQTKDEAYEQWKQQQEAIPAAMETLKKFYENHEATKTLNESKRVAVSLGEGIALFNFSIDKPEVLTRMFTDGGEILQKLTSTQSGEPDVPKQHLFGLFLINPQKFMQDIFNYGLQTGKRKLVEEGQNAQRPQQKTIPAELNGQTSYSTGRYGDRQRT